MAEQPLNEAIRKVAAGMCTALAAWRSTEAAYIKSVYSLVTDE
jgi:hypothetical protein